MMIFTQISPSCREWSVKHMMIMHQYFPRLWYEPYPLHARGRSRECLLKRGLGLCFFSVLVCDLLPRRLFHGFAKGALPDSEEYLSHNFDEHCLEDTSLIWCLSYPSGGAPLISGHYVSW